MSFSKRLSGSAVSSRYWKAAAAVCVGAYFLFFAADGLFAHWAPDDMMNMAGYWERGWASALYSQFLIAGNAYRPAGALFYLPLFSLFGLDPFPFRVVIFALLAVNVPLLYLLARRLGAAELVAGIAALVMSYHAGLAELFYRTSAIYDVLVCFFCLATLLFYLRVRQESGLRGGGFAGARNAAVLLLLFLCALNSKEMAATLPLLALAYEGVYHPPKIWRPRELWKWLWVDNRVALAGIALDALYIFGKTRGDNALTKMEAYRPVFTFGRMIEFHRNALAELFYQSDPLSRETLFAVVLVVTYFAWRKMRRDLRFYWFWILITSLPLEFLVGRTHFCLYFPLAGFALLGATLLADSARGISEWLVREPLFARVRKPLLSGALIALGIAVFVCSTARQKRTEVAPLLARHGSRTWSIIQQLRVIGLHPRASDRILFINDPYEGWDMLFIARLTFHQRALTIWLTNKTTLSRAQVAEMDHVVSFEGNAMRLVR